MIDYLWISWCREPRDYPGPFNRIDLSVFMKKLKGLSGIRKFLVPTAGKRLSFCTLLGLTGQFLIRTKNLLLMTTP